MGKQLYLVQLPPKCDKADIVRIKTVDELEKNLQRMSPSLEQQLCSRFHVYEEAAGKWTATPKIKRIYKATNQLQKRLMAQAPTEKGAKVTQTPKKVTTKTDSTKKESITKKN